MEPVSDAVTGLKRLLEARDISPDRRTRMVLTGLQDALTRASVQTDRSELDRLKTDLHRAGLLDFCVQTLRLDPSRLDGGWSTATTLAQVLSSCCVGAEPDSEDFHRLLLPSVMDGLLSLASQLAIRAGECLNLFRKVMESVGWLLRAHRHLATQVLSSLHYEQIQMCDEVSVSLVCLSLWIDVCSASRDFLSGLSEEAVMFLLDDAVGQLAVSLNAAVGGAAVRLVLLIATQLETRPQPLLQKFRGLDSLLNKDWRGRGFDQEVDQLIALLQSDGFKASHSQDSTEHVRAACVIQAAWRSYQTRRRVKSLPRAVSTLQRRYRARRRQKEQQEEAQRWEEELRYQLCVKRQRARRAFHQKQRQQLHLLPPEQVQSYLAECERCAAVVIQKFWRGFRQRRHYNAHRHTLQHTHTQQQAARTLQRAVRRFLKKRSSLRAPPTPSLWIGQKGLTDSQRAELKRQVEEHIALHPSSVVSQQQCVRLHEEAQRLLLGFLLSRDEERKEEEHRRTLLVHTHTQLDLLTTAPSLAAATATDAELFQSPSAPVAARARQSHNAILQASRLPWWRMLGETDRDDVTHRPAHLDELEAEFGGLFVGGGVN